MMYIRFAMFNIYINAIIEGPFPSALNLKSFKG